MLRIRSRYSENQRGEVLTDFWFNHLYVASTSFRARPWVLLYKRDASRPHVLGPFEQLLLMSAKHPAMIQDLDTARSALPGDEDTLAAQRRAKLRARAARGALPAAEAKARIAQLARELAAIEAEEQIQLDAAFRPREGINENYARELMERHTLGVDGGYTQKDVQELARVFGGWTQWPLGARAQWFRTELEAAPAFGFTREGSFWFRADWHDAGEKQILGERFAAGGGVEEGERALRLLASQPSPARFVLGKLRPGARAARAPRARGRTRPAGHDRLPRRSRASSRASSACAIPAPSSPAGAANRSRSFAAELHRGGEASRAAPCADAVSGAAADRSEHRQLRGAASRMRGPRPTPG